MGDVKFVDTMIVDGLTDAFNNYHMGVTAENVAKQWQITREQQDLSPSLRRTRPRRRKRPASSRMRSSPYTISTKKGDVVVDADEYIKQGVTLEGVVEAEARLRQGRHGDGGERLGPQ